MEEVFKIIEDLEVANRTLSQNAITNESIAFHNGYELALKLVRNSIRNIQQVHTDIEPICQEFRTIISEYDDYSAEEPFSKIVALRNRCSENEWKAVCTKLGLA